MRKPFKENVEILKRISPPELHRDIGELIEYLDSNYDTMTLEQRRAFDAVYDVCLCYNCGCIECECEE